MLADDALNLALLAFWISFVVRYLNNHNFSAWADPRARSGDCGLAILKDAEE
jgi:hypothetical protein